MNTESLYTCKAVEDLINRYINAGGKIATIQEGTLGYGLTVCYGDNLKTAVITEVPLNCWESAHKIRMYNKMPQKYATMLESI